MMTFVSCLFRACRTRCPDALATRDADRRVARWSHSSPHLHASDILSNHSLGGDDYDPCCPCHCHVDGHGRQQLGLPPANQGGDQKADTAEENADSERYLCCNSMISNTVCS